LQASLGQFLSELGHFKLKTFAHTVCSIRDLLQGTYQARLVQTGCWSSNQRISWWRPLL